MHGSSFAPSFVDPDAPEHHTQQYFEIYGNRGMYKDGWWLATHAPASPWDLSPQTMAQFAPGVWHPDGDPVELYYLPDDFSQAHDLAAENPAKVQELRDLFYAEADTYQVTPLLAALARLLRGSCRRRRTQTTYAFRGRRGERAPGMIPPIYAHSYSISADLVVPDGGAEGVIVAEANHLGGFSLFVQDGKLKYTYSMLGVKVYRLEASSALPSGACQRAHAVHRRRSGHAGTGGTVTLVRGRRRSGRHRTIDNTVPHQFHRVRGDGHGPGQWAGRRPGYADNPVRVHRHGQAGGLRHRPAGHGRRRVGRRPGRDAGQGGQWHQRLNRPANVGRNRWRRSPFRASAR